MAATGMVSASERESLEADLSQRSVFEDRLTQHDEAVLSTLSERGLIERADPSALPMDAFDSERTQLARDEVTDAWAVTTVNDPEVSGTFEPLLMVGIDGDEADVRLFVRPAQGDAYAFVNPDKGNPQYVTADGEVVTTASLECDDFYVCGDTCLNCLQSGVTTDLDETVYYDSYQCSYDRCCSSVTGTQCGAEDCWRTCTL